VGHGVIALLAFACRKEPAADTSFPDGFHWGSATAGFQVEMGCPTLPDADCIDPASDWYQWVTDPAIVGDEDAFVTGDDVRTEPGMWETFEDDADRMADDGMTAFRMSIEWSRLFPEEAAEGAASVDELAAIANPAAVARYHEMLAALRDRGIEPYVTVNHYTLPSWVHDGAWCRADPDGCARDGWVSADRIVPRIALYAGYLGREFGGEVRWWSTLNEPLATVASGYVQPGEDRSAPPGLVLDGARAKAVLHAQILGHAAMYDALHAEDADANVGLVMNMADIQPYAPDEADDQLAVEHCDHVYHAMFLDGVTSGAWDDDGDGTFETTRPELAERLDWIGINYYATIRVRGLPFPVMEEVPAFDFLPEIDWIPHGEGMSAVVARAGEYGLPMVVTENGTSSDDDDYRVDMLEEDLDFLRRSIDSGADVRGYLYWSYVDNYEWNSGTSRYFFGLYALDPATKARVGRPVLTRYREIVAGNRL
jgi:beta-glucosidase/6-phospho-beta-glucosidase/beta-galactosidase